MYRIFHTWVLKSTRCVLGICIRTVADRCRHRSAQCESEGKAVWMFKTQNGCDSISTTPSRLTPKEDAKVSVRVKRRSNATYWVPDYRKAPE